MENAQFYVGIGAQKAGTTWLNDYLHRHPQVGASPLKELHFFDAKHRPGMCGGWNDRWRDELTELTAAYAERPSPELKERIRCVVLRLEMIEEPQRYRDYFAALVQEATRAFGEITPSYSLLPRAGFREILGLYPRAKFLFIARDPVERFLSQVRFTWKKRDIRPWDDAEANRLALRYIDNPHFTRRTDYRTTLLNLYSVASPSQVHVLFYERLFERSSTEGVIRALCDFLGIDYRVADTGERFNVSVAHDFSPEVIARLRAANSHVYDYMQATFSAELPESWRV